MGSIGYPTTCTVSAELRSHMQPSPSDDRQLLHLTLRRITPMPSGDSWSMVAYAAYRDNTTGEVYAALSLACKSGGMFYVKDEDETVGPAWWHNVPLELLDMLTPTTREAAIQWRERARRWHGEEREARARLAQAKGRRVRLPAPVTYGGGIGPVQEVLVVDSRRWRTLDGRLLRAPGDWKRLPYTIVS